MLQMTSSTIFPPMDLAWLCLTLKSGDRSGFETGEANISTERFQSKRSKRRTLHFLKMKQRKGQRLCLKEQPRSILSIQIGKKLRPKRLWGYYLYPDCYNYDYNQDMVGFTGECPDIEKQRNENLLWLWKESTALFPSIYLELVLKDSWKARLFVRHRIQEAMRVSTLPQSTYSIPIYAYIRPVYKDSVDDYVSEVRHHCSTHSIVLPWETICALCASPILDGMKGICHST